MTTKLLNPKHLHNPLALISTTIFASHKPHKEPQNVPVKLSYNSYQSTNTALPNDAPPLVIMHGLFGSKSNWNSLSKVFYQKTEPERRVISIDARNHGDSPHCPTHTYEHLAGDVKELLEQLKLPKISALGHSMGGRAMMFFALKYPELVDKLIIADISPVSTSSNLKSMSAIFAAMERVRFPRDVPIANCRSAVDLELSRYITDRSIRAFLLTNIVKKVDGSYGWRVNLRVLKENFENHIAAFPDVRGLKYKGPVLFLGGGASDYIQKKDHPEILKLFPNAEFKYIDGAGHWVHSDRPQEFLQTCLEFLNRPNNPNGM